MLVLSVAAVSVGCSSDPGPTQSPLDPALTAQDPAFDPDPTPAGPTLDQLFLEVGKDSPGFGGMVIDEDGVLSIRVVDTAQGITTQESVSRIFGDAVRGRTTRLMSVQYTFAQLYSWREDLLAKGLPEGVRLVDVDEGRNLVRVGTIDASVAQAVRDLARSLGLPHGAILVEPVGAIVALTDYLTSPIRPVMGGLSIVTTAHGCTLGFKAKKTGSTRYVATNAHCTTTVGTVDGDDVGQPLLQSNYWIGYEVDDPAFTSTNCISGYTCRWADVALAQCDTISQCANYTVARTTSEYTGNDWNQSGSSTLATEPWYVVGELSSGSLTQGASLSKVGATSGWTGGTIVSTCFDVYYATGKLLRCQYDFSAVARSGDSGSPVFQYESSTGKAWLGGILWGSDGSSTSVFSPISGVKTDLGSLTVYSKFF
jgi:hypothetical protein